jgi:transcriptional regulator with XRE-family HTH domain
VRKNPVGQLERVLAKRVRELAAAKGLPVSHVADRAGVSRSMLWELFNHKASPSLATIQKLSDALELEDPLELLRLDPAAPPRKRKSAKRSTS